MDIFKIIGVGLIGGILSMTVKQYKKECFACCTCDSDGDIVFYA